MNTASTLSVISALALLFATRFAAADTVHIENSIHTYSNTGGNVSNGSTIRTGTTSNRLDIHTTVNGHVIEDVHIATTSPVKYEYHFATSSHAVSGKNRTQNASTSLVSKEVTHMATPTRLISNDDFPNDKSSQVFISVFRILIANFSAYVCHWLAF